MSDNDLIRRGDALAAVANLYKWSIAAGEELEDAIAALPAVTPAPDAAAFREAAKRVTGTALHDIFVKRMSHAYVDEDPIEMKGVCMDGYFNLIQIAKDIRALLTEKPHDRA